MINNKEMQTKGKKIYNSDNYTDSSNEEKEKIEKEIKKLNDEKEEIEKDIKNLNDKKYKIENEIEQKKSTLKKNDIINKKNEIRKKNKTQKNKKSDEINTQKKIITKEQIISLFKKNIKGKEHVKNDNYDGEEGHWLETLMNLKPNSNNSPDIGGYEMKKKFKKNIIW